MKYICFKYSSVMLKHLLYLSLVPPHGLKELPPNCRTDSNGRKENICVEKKTSSTPDPEPLKHPGLQNQILTPFYFCQSMSQKSFWKYYGLLISFDLLNEAVLK